MRYVIFLIFSAIPQVSYACFLQPPLFPRVILPVTLILFSLIFAVSIYKLSSKLERKWWKVSIPVYLLITVKFYLSAIFSFNYYGAIDCNEPFFVDSLIIFSMSLLTWLFVFVIHKYVIYRDKREQQI